MDRFGARVHSCKRVYGSKAPLPKLAMTGNAEHQLKCGLYVIRDIIGLGQMLDQTGAARLGSLNSEKYKVIPSTKMELQFADHPE
jgi:hypothetical protein